MTERYPLLGLERGMVLAIARLHGQVVRDAIMIVDTGSSLTTITPQMAQLIGFDLESPLKEQVVHTWAGTISSPVFVVPRVRVFGQEVHDLEVACGELPPKLGLDGVLGLNFLRHFDLYINFREEYIELR